MRIPSFFKEGRRVVHSLTFRGDRISQLFLRNAEGCSGISIVPTPLAPTLRGTLRQLTEDFLSLICYYFRFCKEISRFNFPIFNRVGTMNDVLSYTVRKICADRSFVSFLRIGCAN